MYALTIIGMESEQQARRYAEALGAREITATKYLDRNGFANYRACAICDNTPILDYPDQRVIVSPIPR